MVIAEFEIRPAEREGQSVLAADILVRKAGLTPDDIRITQLKCVGCVLAGPCGTLDNGAADETWLGAFIRPDNRMNTTGWTELLQKSNCKPVMRDWEL